MEVLRQTTQGVNGGQQALVGADEAKGAQNHRALRLPDRAGQGHFKLRCSRISTRAIKRQRMVQNALQPVDQLVTAGIAACVEDRRRSCPRLTGSEVFQDRMAQFAANTHLVEDLEAAPAVKLPRRPCKIAPAPSANRQHRMKADGQRLVMQRQFLETADDIGMRGAERAMLQLNIHGVKIRQLTDNLRNQLVTELAERAHRGAQQVLVQIEDRDLVILLQLPDERLRVARDPAQIIVGRYDCKLLQNGHSTLAPVYLLRISS